MALVQGTHNIARILESPVLPSASPAVRTLFDRVFAASVQPLLYKGEHIQERVAKDRYVTHLFFNDQEQKELVGMYSVDKKPWDCAGIESAMRVHFLHANGSPELQKSLLLKVVAYAIEKKALAIIFQIPPAASGLGRFLEGISFKKQKGNAEHHLCVHRDLPTLQKILEEKPLPPPPPREQVLPPPAPLVPLPPPVAELPIPRDYKSVTLMKRYLHMIRDGYRTRDGKIYKTVEGRINRGMFASYKLPVGSGIRFFYMQDANDDVQCTILATRTFRTFRDMLVHYGYQKLVPDVANLEDAVAAYARIPGYSQKEKESGVVAIELRVDGSGPQGPAHRHSAAERHDDRSSGARKRSTHERPDYDSYHNDSRNPKNYRYG